MSVRIDALKGEELRSFMRSLPKTDLHCHLDGSLRIKTVSELASQPEIRARAERYGYSLPEDTSEANIGGLLFPGKDCESLEDYLLAFDITCAWRSLRA